MTREPFRGLQSYRYIDEQIFAGRDDQVEALWRLVSRRRACLLYGSSGAGKSSLVNAGLLPRLRKAGVTVDRLRFQARVGQEIILEPIESGDEALLLPSALRTLTEAKAEVISAETLTARVNALPDLPRALLIFDQFEELVTLVDSAPDRAGGELAQERVVAALLEIYRVEYTAAKILFVFREDFLAQLDFFIDQCPDLSSDGLRIHPPATHRLDEILAKPFAEGRRYKLPAFTPELSAKLAEEFCALAAETRLTLSDVQMACLQLYLYEGDREQLLKASGIAKLIEEHLKGKIGAMAKHDQPLAICLLIALLTAVGTRNFLSVESLGLQPILRDARLSKEKLESVLQELVAAGLVLRDWRGGEQMYEIVSESLVPWIRQQRRAAELETAWRKKKKQLWRIAAVLAMLLLGALGWWRWKAEQKKLAERAQADRTAASLADNSSVQQKAEYVQTVLGQCKTEENSRAVEKAVVAASASLLTAPTCPDKPDHPPDPNVLIVNANEYKEIKARADLVDQLKVDKTSQQSKIDGLTKVLDIASSASQNQATIIAGLRQKCGDLCKDSVQYSRLFVYVDKSLHVPGADFKLDGNSLESINRGTYFAIELPPQNGINYLLSSITFGKNPQVADLAIHIAEGRDVWAVLMPKTGSPDEVMLLDESKSDWTRGVIQQNGSPLRKTGTLFVCANSTFQQLLLLPPYFGPPGYPNNHTCGNR